MELIASVRFGILSLGTGGDFQRTIGLDKLSPKEQLQVIMTGVSIAADVGSVRFADFDGDVQERFFLNVSSVGVGATVCHSVNHSSKFLGGFCTFYLHTAFHSLTYELKSVRFKLFDDSLEAVAEEDVHLPVYPEGNEGEWTTSRALNFIVGNARYQGGGMKVAPNASIQDGKFDVVLMRDTGYYDLLVRLQSRIYNGTHIELEDIVQIQRATRVVCEPATPGDRIMLEIDGEVPGTLPAEWNVLKAQVNLITPEDFAVS